MEIPLTVEEITPEWLTGALRRGGHLDYGRVESAQVERVGASMGFVGDVFRANLEYSEQGDSAPSSVVVKTASVENGVRAFANRRGLYEREVRILTDLHGAMGIRTPRPFFGQLDHRSGGFVLVMEDLSHLRAGDEMGAHSLADAREAIRAVAGLHAHWWNNERLQSLDWLDRPLDGHSIAIREQDYRAAWNRIEPQLREDLPSDVFGIGEALVHEFRSLWSNWIPSALTLNHGDCRFANLFFGDEGVIAFDWQFALHGPPAIDLADLLVWSLTTDQRRKNEKSLLDLYAGELARLGVERYSRRDLVDDVRLGMLRNLENYVTTIHHLGMTDEAGRAWIEAVSPRMIALAEWNCEALLVR